MSRLPPFDPLNLGAPPAIPATPATPGEQNSTNSRNSRGARPKPAGPPEGYRLKHPSHDNLCDAELTGLEAQVKAQGYVLLWSNVLNDSVAFYRAEKDRQKIPPGFVPYSLQEIQILFSEDEDEFSVNGLRLIHEAKKLGGHVVNSEREHESEAL